MAGWLVAEAQRRSAKGEKVFKQGVVDRDRRTLGGTAPHDHGGSGLFVLDTRPIRPDRQLGGRFCRRLCFASLVH